MSSPERPPRSNRLVLALTALVAVGAVLSRRPLPRTPAGVDPEDVQAGYQRRDMSTAVVIAGALGLLCILGGVFLLVTVFESAVTGTPPSVSRPEDLIGGLTAAPEPTPPAPALEAQPGQSLQPYLAAEQQKLSSYRWVDRQAGVVAMPIDRAMDLVAQRGLPARDSPPAGTRDDGASSPSSASSGRVDEAYP